MTKRKRTCICCRLEYPEDELEQHQTDIHGVDSFDSNSTEESDSLEPSTSISGTLHFCDECDFKTIHKKSLKIHKQSKHGAEGTWFYCDEDECDFKTIHKKSLKRHKLAVHKI